jgi:hypothetical protein
MDRPNSQSTVERIHKKAGAADVRSSDEDEQVLKMLLGHWGSKSHDSRSVPGASDATFTGASATGDAVLTPSKEGHAWAAFAPLHSGWFVFECIDAIHGREAQECGNYKPTRHELRALVRHWTTVELNLDMESFLYRRPGNAERRMVAYASSRIEYLEKVLGGDAFYEEYDAVMREARRRLGEELWEVYMDAPRDELEMIAAEVQRQLSHLDQRRADHVTQEKALAHLRQHPCGYYLDDVGDLWSLTDDGRVAGGGSGEWLVLRVTMARGTACLIPGCTVPRPTGWYPPFGIR